MSRWLWEWMNAYGGRTLGVLAGLVLALMILEYGLLRSIFVLILVAAGWLIGLRVDEAGGLGELYERSRRRD
jgi:uncharacterized membrane protein